MWFALASNICNSNMYIQLQMDANGIFSGKVGKTTAGVGLVELSWEQAL